ncbi:MAG: TonB-dependent receptor, partial [Gemmatimonadales bacterium]
MLLPRRPAAILALMIVTLFSRANAQNNPAAGTPSSSLRGRVVDSASRLPITRASVELTSAAGAPALTTVTSADGSFRLQGVHAGRYGMRIRAIGYRPTQVSGIVITAGTSVFDLRTVALAASVVELPPLQVTAPEQVVQLAPDRNTYVVRDMPTTRGGTVLDVLRNVPTVDVDIDNSVSLRGNAGVVVQINGRPSPLKASQLGNYLAQLPAEMVNKVEIVTNPSARESPDGVAGIINVVLKQKPDAGASGAITAGGSTRGHVDLGGNAGFQHGAFTFYGSYGFFRENRPRSESLFRQNLYLDPITFLDESGTRTQSQNGHTFTTNAGYQLGEHDRLSLENLLTTRGEREARTILYRDLNAAHDPTGLSDRTTTATNRQIEFETTLAYDHDFVRDGHTLSSEVHIVRDQEDGPQSVLARTLGLGGAPITTTARESQTNLDHGAENSVKLDYVRPLAEHVQIEAGYKGSLNRFHTALGTDVFDVTTGSYLPDSSRTRDFTYDQTVHAAYGIIDAQPGKFLLQGGVRVEHASTSFHVTALGATYDNGYNSLFPSALVAYNLDEFRRVKLSYSTRIQRPDDGDVLDPTPHYADPLNLSIGNPNLKPEYTRAFELGLERRRGPLTIQVTPFFRHTIDAVRSIRTIDTLGVTTRSYANIATSDAYGTDATVALNGTRLSGFASASAFRQVSNAPDLGTGFAIRTFGWSVRTNVSLRVSGSLDAQGLFSYQAPMTVEQGRNGSRVRFSLAARQKLMNDRMSVTLRVIDPLNTSRET